MKKLSVLSIFCAVLLLCVGQAMAVDVGPAKYFNMKEILDESTLNTVIAKDSVVASKVRPGKNVRVIELNFTSQTWQGMQWKHPTRIYVPDGYKGGGNAGIIGTVRNFFDDPVNVQHTIAGTQLRTEEQYAEATAIDLGMPIMIFGNPGEKYLGMDEDDLMGYALKKVVETGDLSWYGYAPIARAYLRAITLMHSLPGVGTERAAILGCSKRGVAVSLATGIDPDRVAGVMVTCFYGGNILYGIAKQFAEFGPNVRGPAKQRLGPGYQPAERVLRIFNNPVGLQVLTHFDPYFWRNKIKARYLVTLGTNDEFYALGAANSMLTEMSGDKAFLAIDNEKHGWVSMKHLTAWRMWLAHTFLNRPIAKIDAKGVVAADQLVVSARINTPMPPVAVRLFYSYNKATDDWREARWQSVAMTSAEGTYTARLPMNMGQKLGYYVEVEDQGPGGTGLVSSLVEVAE